MKKWKIISMIILGIMIVGTVSAVLVNYLSNTISETVDFESPFSLDGENFVLDMRYSGEDAFALVSITNNADRDIIADIEIAVSPDIVGISLAVTDDINYCFSNQGNMNGITDCKTDYEKWLSNNIDWNDWVADSAYSDALYPSNLVVNTDENSFLGIGYSGNKLILPDMGLPAETTVYGVLYAATDVALTPGTYQFDITIRP